MRKIKSQSGFSAVEALIVVLVLVVLAGAGYFVWHKHHESTPKVKTGTSSSSTSTTYPIAKAGLICTDFSAPGQCETADHKIYQLAKVPTSAKIVAWSSLPVSLQNTVTADWNKTSCSDANSAPAKDSTILFDNSGNYADAAYGCGEGAAHYLYVKTNGMWQKVAATQVGTWACDTISKYHVPNSFLASPAPNAYAPLCYVSTTSNDHRVL